MKHPGRLTSFLVATGLAFAVGSPSLGSTRASGLVASAATEAAITRATAQLLERAQLAHRPLDDDLAGRFLARYLDDLDGSRSLFLQADVNDFSVYRSSLVDATRTLGDTRGAHAIFSRYLQRLSQQVAYTSELLRTERFDFSGHDVYSFDREHAERPRDLKSAQLLWRQQLRAEYLQAKLAGKKRKDIVRTLLRRRQQQLATMKALDSSEILEIYLNALAHVYDPHSDYLGREAMDSLNIAMKLSLFGIGASLESKDGYCRIRELIPGGPAARSGLVKAGDRILAVAQAQGDPVDITNLPLARAVQLIRGPKDSIVKLTLLPVGEPEGSPTEVVPLRRDQIHLDDQRAKATIMDLPVTTGGTVRVGVVVLPSFYVDLDRRKNEPTHGATADVAALLRKLRHRARFAKKRGRVAG